MLEENARIGSYVILSPLGAGGMGEVYLARDDKLDRQVAIKVLPETMMRDPERIARFEREAKLLASLNHPNIAAIYGFDEADGKRFLVMEYIEGDTLGRHLDDGPASLEDALDIAKQMAEALEAAHEKGIVHRDLKPGNVMTRADGSVKVLDFGLAKAVAEDPSSSVSENSPTITANFTKPGVVLGTAAYMSPEQARGRQLDKRTDIWSFGVILYEMLTGVSVFRGETATDSMGAIMHKEPDWSLLPAGTPPTVQLLLRRCLAKDRRRRLHDIADARVELEAAIVDPTASALGIASYALREADAAPKRRPAAVLLPVLSLGLAIGLGYALVALEREKDRPAPLPVHLNVELSPDAPLAYDVGADVVLSPDGSRLVCVVKAEREAQLYTRRLDQPVLSAISGTGGGTQPFFSPDGQWIGFYADAKLKRVAVAGGTPISICEMERGRFRGASWGDDGTIVFAPHTTTGLWRVSESGGEPEPLTTLGDQERSHRFPDMLPDGRGVLFTAQMSGQTFNESSIEVLDFATNQRRVLHVGGTFPRFAASGHVVFMRERTLYAMPFDLVALRATGQPVPVLEGVGTDSRNGTASFAFARNGTLAYQEGSAIDVNTSIHWSDRSGQLTPILDRVENYIGIALSPDDKRFCVQRWEEAAGTSANLWVYDLERGTMSRLTFAEQLDFRPVWSHDGENIYFSSTRGASTPNVFVKPSDGTGEARAITTSDRPTIATDLTPDGTHLLLDQMGPHSEGDIMLLDVTADGATIEPLLQTPIDEDNGAVSPCGNWFVYESLESGLAEIYVRPFSGGGGKWQVSTDGGRYPKWSHDGTEIFYHSGDSLWRVPIQTDESAFQAGTPEQLFEIRWGGMGFPGVYDVASDDQRFLVLKGEETDDPTDLNHVQFVFNWFEDLKRSTSSRR